MTARLLLHARGDDDDDQGGDARRYALAHGRERDRGRGHAHRHTHHGGGDDAGHRPHRLLRNLDRIRNLPRDRIRHNGMSSCSCSTRSRIRNIHRHRTHHRNERMPGRSGCG